jgi:hypothetical protein
MRLSKGSHVATSGVRIWTRKVWTQGLSLARQAFLLFDSLHQSFFCEGFFQDRVSWTICLGLALNHGPSHHLLLQPINFPLNKDLGSCAIWPEPTALSLVVPLLSFSFQQNYYCFVICVPVQCFTGETQEPEIFLIRVSLDHPLLTAWPRALTLTTLPLHWALKWGLHDAWCLQD